MSVADLMSMRPPRAVVDDTLRRLLPEAPNSNRACVLLHGYATTPLELVPLAEALRKDGFSTYSPWLPDHGISSGALAVSHVDRWIYPLEELMVELRSRHSVIAIVGQSIGGTLALRLASRNVFAGVVAINPYFSLRAYAGIAPEGIARRLAPFLPYVPFLDIANGTRQLRTQFAGGLRFVPLAPLAGLRTLADETLKNVGAIRSHVLFITSAGDRLVDPASSETYARAIGSTTVARIVLKRSGHMAVLDAEADECIAAIRGFLHRYAGAGAKEIGTSGASTI